MHAEICIEFAFICKLHMQYMKNCTNSKLHMHYMKNCTKQQNTHTHTHTHTQHTHTQLSKTNSGSSNTKICRDLSNKICKNCNVLAMYAHDIFTWFWPREKISSRWTLLVRWMDSHYGHAPWACPVSTKASPQYVPLLSSCAPQERRQSSWSKRSCAAHWQHLRGFLPTKRWVAGSIIWTKNPNILSILHCTANSYILWLICSDAQVQQQNYLRACNWHEWVGNCSFHVLFFLMMFRLYTNLKQFCLSRFLILSWTVIFLERIQNAFAFWYDSSL